MIKLVFVDNKEIKGFVFGEVGIVGGTLTRKRKILAIHEIGVTEDSRHLGIGTQLLDEMKRIGKEKKCEEILLSVWSFNEKAINFYIKNGLKCQTMRMEFEI